MRSSWPDGPEARSIPIFNSDFLNSIDVFTAYGLRQALAKGRFDVVHAHVARDYTVTAAAAWGLPNVTVVMTRHLLYRVRRNPLYRRVDGWIAPTSANSENSWRRCIRDNPR